MENNTSIALILDNIVVYQPIIVDMLEFLKKNDMCIFFYCNPLSLFHMIHLKM